MSASNRPEDFLWVHLAKAIGIVMVVIIHTSADLFYEYGHVPMFNWWSANVYQSFSRIGVPFFFMASGFLLLGRQESLRTFFKVRVIRIVLPLAFWTLFFISWRKLFFGETLGINQAISDIVQHEAFPHLWFLYAMLAVYLCYPIMRIFIQNSTTNLLWYFIVLWMAILVVIPTVETYTGIQLNKYLTENLGLFTGYLGYTVLGYLLGNIPRNNRLIAAMIPMAVISPFATLLRTYIATESAEKINEAFYHYLSINVVLASASVFYFIRLMGNQVQNQPQNKVTAGTVKLSKSSYGIYLIHPIFIQLLAAGSFGFRLSAFSGNPWITIPISSLICLILSYLTVKGMLRIPILRNVIS